VGGENQVGEWRDSEVSLPVAAFGGGEQSAVADLQFACALAH
jgi:hypothetical protein